MKLTNVAFSALFCIVLVASAFSRTVDNLATLVVSGDKDTALASIAELRSMGSVGLDALFVKYAADIEKYGKDGVADENWKRVATALDSVAMQKDAYTSHLYWYTDLAEAKRIAKAKNKPVLTLRLLGNLNEEFSCGNSRLFRAILYPNAEISKYLRENYILHWSSVRPAPRVTIDFGDGRKIERTITGNSIHYILASNGEIIDALPGLYSPKIFLKYVKQGSEQNRLVNTIPTSKQTQLLMKYRKANFDQIVAGRKQAVDSTGVELAETRSGTLAVLAAPMAVSKMIVVDEYTILRVYDDFAKFEPAIKFDDWDKLSNIYSPTLDIDTNTVAMIRRQNQNTGLSTDEYKALFTKLENFIALDTTRNDFIFHTKLYEWLNARSVGDLEAFNARVYDQIFQTPNTDK